MSPTVTYMLRNLTRSPFISLIVLVTMFVVGAGVNATLDIVGGIKAAFASTGRDNVVVVLSRDAPDETQSWIKQEWLGRIATHAEVVRASPEAVIQVLQLDPRGGVLPITLRALEPQGFDFHGLSVIEGRMPEKGMPEFIVGDDLRQRIPWLTVGTTLDMVNEHFRCVGVFHSHGYHSGELWTTRAMIQADPARVSLGVVYLETRDAADAQRVIAELKSDRSMTIHPMTEPALSKKLAGNQTHMVRALIVAFLLLVGGAVLVASVLLLLFQERYTSDLFVLRAIGFRAAAIVSLVILQTELLALSGGFVGLIISALGLRHRSITSSSPGGGGSTVTFRLISTWENVGLTVATLLVVGLIGATLPIGRALRGDIVKGLREE